jgi:hypothetical protein
MHGLEVLGETELVTAYNPKELLPHLFINKGGNHEERITPYRCGYRLDRVVCGHLCLLEM